MGELSATERLRRRYLPDRVRLLFVGESAPSGGTFFYRENSTLYFEMRSVLTDVLPKRFERGDFLKGFRAAGCYLDDLCLEPINQLPKHPRYAKRVEAEASFGRRLLDYDPCLVVAIGKTTAAPHIRAAAARASSDALVRVVLFPGQWAAHKQQFRGELASILTSAERADVFVSQQRDQGTE